MEVESAAISAVTTTQIETRAEQRKVRSQKPNYARIHKDRLPLDVHPLPAFIPHNPLSLLRIAYALISEFFISRKAHGVVYQGYFDVPTRSVHVTDQKFVRGLWERGFFGKGSLSRSEPTWLHSERTRLGLIEMETSDQVTRARRKEREKMKKERARVEREVIEQQRLKEKSGGCEVPDDQRTANQHDSAALKELPQDNGRPINDSKSHGGPNGDISKHGGVDTATEEVQPKSVTSDLEIPSTNGSVHPDHQEEAKNDVQITNQEHLQLSLEEALFLTYGLGVLSIQFPSEIRLQPPNNFGLLRLFRQYSYFPPSSHSDLQPDDPFLLHYVTYHYFRSLGWVVRDGIKFAVDYLLYQRGPVFDHAEFAVIIIRSYTDNYWFENEQRRAKVQKTRKEKNWWWLHATNRVLSQVTKTLVLCYVDIPSPLDIQVCEEKQDLGGLLKLYKVREFCIKRWNANRNRD